MKVLLLIAFLLFLTNCQLFGRIQCPKISCNNDLATDVCYRVLGDHPYSEIALSTCPDEYICDWTDVAWPDSDKHFFKSGWPHNSTFYFKKKEARCYHWNDMR